MTGRSWANLEIKNLIPTVKTQRVNNEIILSNVIHSFSGVHPLIRQLCILHIPHPISTKLINSPLFQKNLLIPHIFVQFPFFSCLRCLLPPILTMMHLRIMLYTYWTPLHSIIMKISIVPLQGNYLGALPMPARLKRTVFR